MVARFAGLVAGVLAFNAIATSDNARSEPRSEPERGEQVTNVTANSEPILSASGSTRTEGPRRAEESPSGLEREADSPPSVGPDMRAGSRDGSTLLIKPTTLQTDTFAAAPLRPAPSETDLDVPAAATDQPAATSQDQSAASSLLPSETWVEVIPNGPTPQPPMPPSDAPVAPAASRVAALIERPAAPPDPPGPAPSSAVPAPSMVKPAHSAHPKPAKPLPATALTVLNGRDVPVVSVTVRVKAKTVEHARPLASHAKAVLKLPKLIGCRAKVTATYAGGEVSETGVVDLCRERLVRLTD